MKKLKLKALDLGASELLSREQLKNVLGGDGSGDGDYHKCCKIGSLQSDPNACGDCALSVTSCDTGYQLVIC